MKFGVMFANVGPFGQAEGLVHLAQTAERVGFESLWTVEHVVVPKGYRSPYPYAESGKMPGPEESPIPDPLVWLGYAAAGHVLYAPALDFFRPRFPSLPEPERYPHRKIGPVVKGVTEAFGAERLIYGGGWGAGVTARAYRAERERVAGYLAHLSADERAAVLGGNAAKLFGFTS